MKRERTTRVRKSESEACLIDTRLTDGEFVVIADVPVASKEDLSAGIDSRTNELVISKTGTVVGRVALPWASSEPEGAWFKNGILEVHLKPESPESLEEPPS